MIDYTKFKPESREDVIDDLRAVSTEKELNTIEPFAKKFGVLKEFNDVKSRLIKEKKMTNKSAIVNRVLNATQKRKHNTPLIGPEFGYKWDPNKEYNLPTTGQARKMIEKARKIRPLPDDLTFASFKDWCDRTGAMGLTLHDLYDVNRAVSRRKN